MIDPIPEKSDTGSTVLLDNDPSINMGNATHYIPMFKLVTPDDTIQIVDNYSHKQRTVQERDMGRVYQQIYTEKCA